MTSGESPGRSTAPVSTGQARSYADPCGVARALDAVGERWALLVVRELSLGAQRFGQLRAGLPGVSPNVLSQRLRDLEAAGVLWRHGLDPSANTTVYELTDEGYALDPVLQALGRWGAGRPSTTTREMSAVSFLRSLRVLVVPDAPDVEYGLQVAGEPFSLNITGGTAQIIRGCPDNALATLGGDVEALRTALLLDGDLRELEAAALIRVSGDRGAAVRLPKLFRIPTA